MPARYPQKFGPIFVAPIYFEVLMAPFVITLKHFLAYSDQLSMFAVSLKDPVSNPKVKPSNFPNALT